MFRRIGIPPCREYSRPGACWTCAARRGTSLWMRVVEVRPPFGVEQLAYADRVDPTPGPGQIVLKMRALSLNYRDLLVVNGVNRWRPPGPRIPVSDGVGTVAEVGDGVTRVRVGDRVAPIFYPLWTGGGPAPEKMDNPLGGAVADGLLAERALV